MKLRNELFIIILYTFATMSADAASVVSRSSRASISRAPTISVNTNKTDTTTQTATTTTSATTVASKPATVEYVDEPDDVDIVDTTVGYVDEPDDEPIVVENKSAQFSSSLGDALSSNSTTSDTALAQMVRAQRAALDAAGNTVAVRSSQTSNTCDADLRACMTDKCGKNFTKCASDTDTTFGTKLDSCRRNTKCTATEFKAFSAEIKSDRASAIKLGAFNDIIDCGQNYDACIVNQCGATYSKCLGKSAGDSAISKCNSIAKQCSSMDSGLASRTMSVFATLRQTAEKQISSDEKKLYTMRDQMRSVCSRLGAMLDDRSLDCVYTVNFIAGEDSTLYSSKKAYAGNTFDCTPQWFGLDITTFMENAYRKTRAQTAASSAMLGSGVGMAVGALTSGAIGRAIDTHNAETELKKAECDTAQGKKWSKFLGKCVEDKANKKTCEESGGKWDTKAQDCDCSKSKYMRNDGGVCEYESEYIGNCVESNGTPSGDNTCTCKNGGTADESGNCPSNRDVRQANRAERRANKNANDQSEQQNEDAAIVPVPEQKPDEARTPFDYEQWAKDEAQKQDQQTDDLNINDVAAAAGATTGGAAIPELLVKETPANVPTTIDEKEALSRLQKTPDEKTKSVTISDPVEVTAQQPATIYDITVSERRYNDAVTKWHTQTHEFIIGKYCKDFPESSFNCNPQSITCKEYKQSTNTDTFKEEMSIACNSSYQDISTTNNQTTIKAKSQAQVRQLLAESNKPKSQYDISNFVTEKPKTIYEVAGYSTDKGVAIRDYEARAQDFVINKYCSQISNSRVLCSSYGIKCANDDFKQPINTPQFQEDVVAACISTVDILDYRAVNGMYVVQANKKAVTEKLEELNKSRSTSNTKAEINPNIPKTIDETAINKQLEQSKTAQQTNCTGGSTWDAKNNMCVCKYNVEPRNNGKCRDSDLTDIYDIRGLGADQPAACQNWKEQVKQFMTDKYCASSSSTISCGEQKKFECTDGKRVTNKYDNTETELFVYCGADTNSTIFTKRTAYASGLQVVETLDKSTINKQMNEQKAKQTEATKAAKQAQNEKNRTDRQKQKDLKNQENACLSNPYPGQWMSTGSDQYCDCATRGYDGPDVNGKCYERKNAEQTETAKTENTNKPKEQKSKDKKSSNNPDSSAYICDGVDMEPMIKKAKSLEDLEAYSHKCWKQAASLYMNDKYCDSKGYAPTIYCSNLGAVFQCESGKNFDDPKWSSDEYKRDSEAACAYQKNLPVDLDGKYRIRTSKVRISKENSHSNFKSISDITATTEKQCEKEIVKFFITKYCKDPTKVTGDFDFIVHCNRYTDKETKQIKIDPDLFCSSNPPWDQNDKPNRNRTELFNDLAVYCPTDDSSICTQQGNIYKPRRP